jgi:hypothetical protein
MLSSPAAGRLGMVHIRTAHGLDWPGLARPGPAVSFTSLADESFSDLCTLLGQTAAV